MSEDKKTNLDELYQDSDKLEFDEKPSKATPQASSISFGKRKPESLKSITTSSSNWKKTKKDDDSTKGEEQLKAEEEEKKELILKIEDACSPDLLGGHEEIMKMRKELKLQTMSLNELKKAWSRIMSINGSDHPRHYIWQVGIVLARKLENILDQYPSFSAPSFASRLEGNPLVRQKMHMWALDKFPHSQIAPEMSLVASVFQEYNSAREFGRQKQKQTEAWGSKQVAEDIQEKFSDL